MSSSPARRRPSWRVVLLVILLDAAVGTATGFAVYFAERKFGAPTPPRNVRAAATTCVPDECTSITSSVTLSWAPPAAGGVVTQYLIVRDGEEFERLEPDTLRFVDEDVDPGDKRTYAVQAIGDEGTGVSSTAVARVPLPPASAARFSGAYRVEVTVRTVDLLSRYWGIVNPSVGDTTSVRWSLQANCLAEQGACEVRIGSGGFLDQRGARTYAGEAPARAECDGRQVSSTNTLTLRVTGTDLIRGVLTVTSFDGLSETDFSCGGDDVHAVSSVEGSLT